MSSSDECKPVDDLMEWLSYAVSGLRRGEGWLVTGEHRLKLLEIVEAERQRRLDKPAGSRVYDLSPPPLRLARADLLEALAERVAELEKFVGLLRGVVVASLGDSAKAKARTDAADFLAKDSVTSYVVG